MILIIPYRRVQFPSPLTLILPAALGRCPDLRETRRGPARSQSLQKSVGLCPVRKQLLLRLKLDRVHASAASPQPDGMLQMKHLVVDDVFQHVRRHGKVIENAADDDGIVRRVVVAQNTPSLSLAPAHSRAAQQSVKEARIQIVEEYVQVIKMPTRGAQALASAHLPNQVSFPHNVVAGDIFPIAARLPAINWPAIHLRQQNMGDRA